MTSPSADGLRGKIVSGVGWKILGQGFQQATSTAVALVLVHLLTPHEYGVAAMALAFSGIALLFTDFALGAALIQREMLTEEDRSTVFWTTIGAGVVVSAVGVSLAPLVASFFSTPEVEALFAAAWAGAPLWALGATQSALLTRELRFRSLELRAVAAGIVSGVLALALAVAGAGAWAIIAQSLCFAGVSSLLVWRLSPWRPRWLFSTASLRALGPFGLRVFGSRFLAYLTMNADNLLVGRYLGPSALGTYSVAYNAMYLPISRITQPVQHVFFAALSRVQHEPMRLGRTWLRGNHLVVAVEAPAFLGMIVVAPDFVPVVLGARWEGVVPVLQLLSLAGVAQSFMSLNWSALQAAGHAGALLRFMVVSTVLTVGAFVVGLEWGIVGVAGMFAAARLLIAAGFTWLVCSSVGVGVREYVRVQRGTVGLALAMVLVVYVARVVLVETDVPPLARLIGLVLFGIGVYLGLVLWRAKDIVEEARGIVRRRAYAL